MGKSLGVAYLWGLLPVVHAEFADNEMFQDLTVHILAGVL